MRRWTDLNIFSVFLQSGNQAEVQARKLELIYQRDIAKFWEWMN